MDVVNSQSAVESPLPPNEDCSDFRLAASAYAAELTAKMCVSSYEFFACEESADDPSEGEPLTSRPVHSPPTNDSTNDPPSSPRELFEWRQLLLQAS